MTTPDRPLKGSYSTGAPREEADRLRSFETPNLASRKVIGELGRGAIVGDFGAGENPWLREYTQSQGGLYVAVDYRKPPLTEQRRGGALTVRTRLQELPVPLHRDVEGGLDIAHVRFVLAHIFDEKERRQVIEKVFNTLNNEGKAAFIDYDWTQMQGNDAVNALRDFTLEEINRFQAGYGANDRSVQEVADVLGTRARVTREAFKPEIVPDYAVLLAHRAITLQTLLAQNANPATLAEATTIFDTLQAQVDHSEDEPYHMPDIAIVTAEKV